MSSEQQNDSSDSKITAMKSLFSDQRGVWKRKIRKLTRFMQIPEKLPMVEIAIRNEVMNIADEKAQLLEGLISISKILRRKKADSIVELKTNSDLKIKNQSEQNILMESGLNSYIERQELIEMQVEYLDRAFANLKDLSWAIKNRVDLAKMGIE